MAQWTAFHVASLGMNLANCCTTVMAKHFMATYAREDPLSKHEERPLLFFGQLFGPAFSYHGSTKFDHLFSFCHINLLMLL